MKLGIIALTVGSFVNCGVLALTVGKLKVEAVLCRIQYQKALVVVSVFGNKVKLVAPAVLEDLLQLLWCDFMASGVLFAHEISGLALVIRAVINYFPAAIWALDAGVLISHLFFLLLSS